MVKSRGRPPRGLGQKPLSPDGEATPRVAYINVTIYSDSVTKIRTSVLVDVITL
jgi:hypothetical protein